MKTLFIILIFAFTITFTHAQTLQLKIELSDGSTVIYNLADIQKVDFSEITNIDDQKKLIGVIKKFTLLQNYPNPFNPSTTIEFQLPKNGNVDISVYDLNGRLVKKLYDGQQSVGTHQLKWAGENSFGQSVASGLYIYTIQFEDEVLSKKMIYLK